MTRKHDRKSWRESWRLFNQAIYIYLISCRVESSFRVELSSQASQFDLSAWIQLLNSTRHFFKKISIQLDTFRVEYSTRHDQSRWNKKKKKRRKESKDEEIDINNLALALFMLVSTINSQHFYTSAKMLKKSWLCYQLQEDNTMLWRLEDRVFEKKCSCENASHRLWTMRVCKTSSRD